jgi:hypothetical protein
VGYTSVAVPAGRTVHVTFPLNDRSFATWATSGWQVLSGCYRLSAGTSSRDLPSTATIGRGAACAGEGAQLSTAGDFYLPVPPTAGSSLLAAPRISCAHAGGTLATHSLEGLRLGITRRSARSLFGKLALRGRRYMDFFCTGAQGIRVGYPSARLLRTLPAGVHRRVRGRVVLILTSSKRFSLRGIHTGARVASAARRARLTGPFVIGANDWYLLRVGSGRGVLKVRHGVVQEVGLADPSLTRTHHRDTVFLRSFS